MTANANKLNNLARSLAACAAFSWCCVAPAQEAQPSKEFGPGERNTRLARPPEPKMPEEIDGLAVDEHLGATIPPDITFTDADGRKVKIGEYFKGDKPVVLAMVYYDCPIVCDVLMMKQTECFSRMDLQIGDDYRVLWFSFDPNEGPELAKSKSSFYYGNYAQSPSPLMLKKLQENWKLHTSDAVSAAALAKSLGFKYRRLDSGEYSHPVATYIISPSGKITRYIHGFDLNPTDVKLSLLAASEGTIEKSIGDRLMAFCYMLDPKTGRYTVQVFRLMQVAGVLTVAMVGTGIGLLILREKIRGRSRDDIRRAAASALEGNSVPPPTGLAS